MSNISIPNTFSAFTTALSADVNANFTEIATKFNTYAVQKDVDATITAVHTYSTAPVFGFATASQALELNSSKVVQSVAITGTGNYVKSASPTFTGTITAASATLNGTLNVLGTGAFGDSVSATNALVVTRADNEVDLYLIRTGTNALNVYYYNAGVSAGFYDGTNTHNVWVYEPSPNRITFVSAIVAESTLAVTGAITASSTINGQTISSSASLTGTLAVAGVVTLTGSRLNVQGTLAEVVTSPTDGGYTGSVYQSIVTRAATTAYDHFYATANSAVVARIRGDGSALFAQAVTVSAGGITVTGNSTITGTLGGITTLTATTVAGTLSTAAQTNITSVGTLSSLTVSGTVALNGNTTIGDATSDTLTVTARLVSDLVPSTSGTRSLGADTLRYLNGYIDRWYSNFATFEAGAVDTSTQLLFRSSGGTVSCLRMPHGSAPSSPTNGDVWTTASGLFVRINGVTVGPLS